MTSDYGRLVTRAAIVATSLSIFLVIFKVFAWWHTHSVSLLASFVDSMVDIAASGTNLLILRYSLKPADDTHSFGHGKAEALSALGQSMFITGTALFLFLTSIRRIAIPEPIHNINIGIIITIISLVCTLCLVLFQRWVIQKTNSQAIHADMLHYKADTLLNIAILISLLLSLYGVKHADAIFGLGISIYILYSSLTIAYGAIQSLLDHALPKEDQDAIRNIAHSFKELSGFHDLRTRQSGSTQFIQFHVELSDALPLIKAHDIVENLKQALLNKYPHADIIIHQDPHSAVKEEFRGKWT